MYDFNKTHLAYTNIFNKTTFSSNTIVTHSNKIPKNHIGFKGLTNCCKKSSTTQCAYQVQSHKLETGILLYATTFVQGLINLSVVRDVM